MKTIIFSYNTLSIYDMFVYIYLTKLKNDEHKKKPLRWMMEVKRRSRKKYKKLSIEINETIKWKMKKRQAERERERCLLHRLK